MTNVKFILFLFVIVFQSCQNKSAKKQLENTNHLNSKKKDTIISTSYILSHPNFKLQGDFRNSIDFKNFEYDEVKLKNGFYSIKYEHGFDSFAYKFSHEIETNLFIVELYHNYGGGSSEESSLIYLFKKNKDNIILKSKLKYEGSFSSEIINKYIHLSSLNYTNYDGRCCPSLIEKSIYFIKNDTLTLLSTKYLKNEI